MHLKNLLKECIKKSISSGAEGNYTSYSDTKTNSPHISSQVNQQQSQELIKPLAISLMIAIGIGLHNFGEGLAIGGSSFIG